MTITVIGSISTDIIVETSVLPIIGETVQGDDLHYSFGGKGANQAVTCARLNQETFMIGCVGKDYLGKNLVKNLEENNVDSNSVVFSNNTSGTAIIQLYKGDNSIVYIPGANLNLTTQDIRENINILKKSKIVIIQNEVSDSVVNETINLCSTNHIPLLYNPAPARDINRDLIEKVSYITPNESEFSILFGTDDYETVLSNYPNKIIVTLGSEGAVFHDGYKLIHVPSYFVNNIVDTTGAGDCFNGALAVALANNLLLEEAIKFANLAASLAIQKLGAQTGNPYLKDIKDSSHFDMKWNIN